MVFLKERVGRADTENADSEKIIVESCKGLGRRMVRLSVVLAGRNRSGELKRSLVTEPVGLVDSDVQRLGHDVVNLLRQVLKRA